MTALKNSICCLVAALVAPDAIAQGLYIPRPLLRGSASGFAAGVIVKNPTLATGSQIRIKLTGDQTSPPNEAPPQIPNSPIPSYAMSHLSTSFPGIEIDAHSSGSAYIPHLDGNGVPDITNRWLAVTVSVNAASTGAPQSPWAAGSSGGRHAGSDLLTYYFDGSVRVSPILVGNLAQESTREDFGFATSSADDLAALDYGFGVMTEAQNISALFNRAGDYFFSVSSDWATTWNSNGGAPLAWDPATGSMQHAHPGAVYRMVFNGTTWSLPEVYLSAAELGLSDASGDIDALEVSPSTDMVLFSTTTNDQFDPNSTTQLVGSASQLMLYAEDPNTSQRTVRELRHSSGGSNELVRKRLKLGNQQQGNVDAICARDPEIGAGDIDLNVGAPTAQWIALGRPLGLSVQRRATSSSVEELVFQVTGWGGIAPQNGSIVLFKHVGPLPAVPGPQGIPTTGWAFETPVPLPRFATDEVLEFTRTRDRNLLFVEEETSFMAVFYDGYGRRVAASLVVTILDHE